MNTETKQTWLALGIGGVFVSFLPIFPDPYVDRVSFWEWLYRELWESLTGERTHARAVEVGVSNVLNTVNRQFSHSVDLGCGSGSMGGIIRPYTGKLTSVDVVDGVWRALKAGYDEIAQEDIREYSIPSDVDSIFMCEVIEHLSKEDGLHLIQSFSSRAFVLMTTPSNFYTDDVTRHLSLWAPQEFLELGFDEVLLFPTGDETWGDIIVAVRRGDV